MKTFFFLSIFVPLISFSKGNAVDTLSIKMESEISVILTKLRNAENDNIRLMHNMDLRDKLKAFLVHPGALTYPFDLWTTMSTIKSPDGEFRIFNWNVENDFGVHSHFCYIVKPNGKENQVIELKEDKITLPPRPEQTLTADHWYGALYYNIIPIKKGNKTMYTIFGYSGNDRSTNRKLLDVFYFKGKALRMGYPLFQEGPGSTRLLRRVFFEYSEKAIISVKMNENLNAIVFDHLVPETPLLVGMFDFYIPDMTYDGYQWENGVWLYREDIIAYNEQNKKIRYYGPAEDSLDLEYHEENDVWLNPVDANAPNGGGTNAIAPIENVKDKKTKTKKDGTPRSFRIFKNRKGPRSAVTGESKRIRRH